MTLKMRGGRDPFWWEFELLALKELMAWTGRILGVLLITLLLLAMALFWVLIILWVAYFLDWNAIVRSGHPLP